MGAERSRALTSILLVMLLGAPSLAAAAEDEARSFLRIYSDMTLRHDVDVTELYDNAAKVRLTYWRGKELVQSAELTGEQWRKSLRRGWHDQTSRLEASHFENVRVAKSADGELTILATRVSDERCYRDPGYAVKVVKMGSRLYRITEERLSVQLSARCAAS